MSRIKIKWFHSRQKRGVHRPKRGPLRGRKHTFSFESLETRAAPGGSILEMLSLGALLADLDLFRAVDDGGVRARSPFERITSFIGGPISAGSDPAPAGHELARISAPPAETQREPPPPGTDREATPEDTARLVDLARHDRGRSPFHRLDQDLLDELLGLSSERAVQEASRAARAHERAGEAVLDGTGSDSGGHRGAPHNSVPPGGGAPTDAPPPRSHGRIRPLRFDGPETPRWRGTPPTARLPAGCN
jgi:hypothetical protein